ncbi:MAG TPA: hypothetical protein VNT01_12100 [Symbiobacteriaceae bacterium]|nr:hypothetical protein [Symbiobacteriaceae bacterium]
MFYGKGFPATKASGYSKSVPTYGAYTAPGFGKLGFGKPIGFGKPFAKPFGFPATKSTGFNKVVPSTTVVTGPSPGVI